MTEKVKGIGNGIFGMILGIIIVIFGSYAMAYGTNGALYIAQEYPAASLTNVEVQAFVGQLNAGASMWIFGGLIAMIFGINLIVDKAFSAIISAKQKSVGAKVPTFNPPQVMATNVSMSTDDIDKLQKLKGLLEKDLITQQEYDAQKKKIISEI